MRKTKIVSTIGPASNDERILEDLIDAGVDVMRQNFSHGSFGEHAETLQNIRDLAPDLAVMMDTQGPEIRLHEVEEGTVLKEGEELKIVTDQIEGNEEVLSVDHPEINDYLTQGDKILIDDGLIELKVKKINEHIQCEVKHGGKVLSRKSVNVPGKELGLRAPTEKDREDIEFGTEHNFDYVSASFVKSSEDIEEIRDIIEENGSDMHIIAKIEHLKAVQNIEGIIESADGVMIARGDLGVEIPASDVPVLQKEIIEKANKKEKPVITATQMLKSMTESPRATRAEVSDVANAVIDGSDAVMLSEETAIGKFPVKSVEFMGEVLEKMERYLQGKGKTPLEIEDGKVDEIIARNVWEASKKVDAEAIVVHTSSGYTAHKIAKHRPQMDIIAFTDKKTVQRKLNLLWGVEAFYSEFPEHVDDMVDKTTDFLYRKNLVEKEDTLIITAGVPAPVTGITNTLQIREVQSILED